MIRPSHDNATEIAEAYGVSREKFLEKSKTFLDLFRIGKISENKFWKGVSSSLGKDVPKDSKKLWRNDIEAMPSYDKMFDFVEQLKKIGIKTAVLSNVIKPHMQITKKNGGYKCFDKLILSCQVGLAKPDSAIYLLTVKKLKVKPEECIFIDDSEINLKTAEKLGMKVVLAKNSEQVIRDVKNLIEIRN